MAVSKLERRVLCRLWCVMTLNFYLVVVKYVPSRRSSADEILESSVDRLNKNLPSMIVNRYIEVFLNFAVGFLLRMPFCSILET